MMLLTGYKSKKELKASKGKALDYEETSFFGEEYKISGMCQDCQDEIFNPKEG